ncbi:MAG: DUF3575 domain-containing protein [Cytophagales bacterium]|nr:DUF3575 domain-containing protein [Cytophagales bacterium]
MKTSLKLSCTVLLTAFMFSGASAQEKSNVLKINILSPIVRTLNVQYEKKISADGSLQLGFFYTGFSTGGTSFSGFGITPEYRFYLSDTEAPQGIYIAPYLRYQSFDLTEDMSASKGAFTSFGGGLILGKQFIFKEKVVLDLFIGPSYSPSTVKVSSGSATFSTGSFSDFGLRAGVCFGLAF